VAATGSVQERVPFALAGATNDAGDASNTTGDPEADRDGDGVPDKADRCPDKFASFPDGCPRLETGPNVVPIPRLISFARNSTTPTAESDKVIRLVALALTDEHSSMRVELIGHASNDEVGWQRISAARAAAVVAILVHAGVDRRRLVARGERSAPAPWVPPPGPPPPGDPNANVAKDKEAWLAAQRTVEFRVTDPGDPAKDRAAMQHRAICDIIGCAPE
jgi:outer membrane protein OmpA-like peptidoglycan-associated protein